MEMAKKILKIFRGIFILYNKCSLEQAIQLSTISIQINPPLISVQRLYYTLYCLLPLNSNYFRIIIIQIRKSQINLIYFRSNMISNDRINPLPQFQRLARLINQKLQRNHINVRVEVSHPKQQTNYLYDRHLINRLFDQYDIAEIDVLYLWAVERELMTFTKSDFKYFAKMFPFQWESLIHKQKGFQKIKSSPSNICRDFLIERNGKYKNNILFDMGAYKIASIYSHYFINQSNKKLSNHIYHNLDEQILRETANFLQNSQQIQQYSSFFDTSAAKTISFSQTLFQSHNQHQTTINHVSNNAKKQFYVNAFVAKENKDERVRETVLKFNEFMVSDQISQIYTLGLYTNKPRFTYIIPPTISYLEKLAKISTSYNKIYKIIKNSQISAFYNQNYAQNVYQISKNIKERLKITSN